MAASEQTSAVRWISLAALVAFVAVGFVGLVLTFKWPFVESKIQASLARSLHGEVRIDSFQQMYWPEPGFVAHGLSLRRPRATQGNKDVQHVEHIQDIEDAQAPPLAVARRVEVRARWIDLLRLRHTLRLVEIDGLALNIPARKTPEHAEDFPPGDGKDYTGPGPFVAILHLRDSTLEVGTRGKPFVLPVPELTLRDVLKGHAAGFSVEAVLPKPNAVIHATGTFGPLHSTRLAETQVKADFTIANAQLSDLGKLHGQLTGQGRLEGALAAIRLTAATETTQFAVGLGRPATVQASVDATVNGLNGDVVLHSIDAQTGETKVHAWGDVVGKPKTTRIDFDLRQGRIEEVLRPFLRQASPIAGALRASGHARLEPGVPGEKFLDRLRLDAFFLIPDERFTRPSTEAGVSAFSRRAMGVAPASPFAKLTGDGPKGPDEPDVLLSLRGSATLRKAVARTPDLTMRMPGATIHLAGTYDLRGKRSDLTGHLEMTSDLSHLTTGFKSRLLKPLSPFFRRRVLGLGRPVEMTVIPIAVTGTGKFKVVANLFGKK